MQKSVQEGESAMIKNPDRRELPNENANSNRALQFLYLSLTDVAGFENAIRESGKKCSSDSHGNDN